MNKEELVDELAVVESMAPTGFEDCIIGVARSFSGSHAALDESKVVTKLMSRDGMTEEEAREFYEYNILGAGMDNPPVFLELLDD